MNQETKNETLCPVCKGSGFDFRNIWPDGSPSYCTECDGYGEPDGNSKEYKYK